MAGIKETTEFVSGLKKRKERASWSVQTTAFLKIHTFAEVFTNGVFFLTYLLSSRYQERN